MFRSEEWKEIDDDEADCRWGQHDDRVIGVSMTVKDGDIE